MFSPAADYHILEASGDLVIAVRHTARKVARVEPALAVYSRRSRLWHLVIALHDVVAPGHKLARLVVWQLLARLRVNYLALYFRHCASNGAHPDLKRIVGGAHRTARRRLRLSVYYCDLRHMHLVHNVAHDGDRARTSGHNAGTHI